MKYLIKALILMCVFQMCFTHLPISSGYAAYPTGAKPPYAITFAYPHNSTPVVGAKFYVVVNLSFIGAKKIESVNESDTSVSYQWYKNNTDTNVGGVLINGANKQYYTPVKSDINSYLYCEVHGDGIKHSGDFTTRPTNFPVASTMQLSGALILNEDNYPYINDNYPYEYDDNSYINNELTGYLVQYESIPIRMLHPPYNDLLDMTVSGDEIASYQWYRSKSQSNIGGEAIKGAKSSKYSPTKEDFGHYLYFTAKGKGNYSGSVTSNTTVHAVCVVDGIGGGGTSADIPAPHIIDKIEGIPIKQSVLTVSNSVTYRPLWHYQWYRNDFPNNFDGEPIIGANTYKYSVTSEDVGKYLYVTIPGAVSMDKPHAEPVPIVSPVTDIVTDSEARLTNISINNRGYLGSVRNHSIGVTSTVPSNAVGTVQWYRNDIQSNIGGEPILGATYAEYIPTSYDVGKYLYCISTPVFPFAGEPVASEVSDEVRDIAIVSFDPNGGYYGGENWEVTIGETLWLEIFKAMRYGYTFKGWATTSNAAEPDFTTDTIVTSDITIYAVWERIDGFEKVETPIATPDGSRFASNQSVTLSCATEGASIYYTINGTMPTRRSTLYTEPFTLSTTTTVKAFAVKADTEDSDVVSATYTKRNTSSGSYDSGSSTLTSPTVKTLQPVETPSDAPVPPSVDLQPDTQAPPPTTDVMSSFTDIKQTDWFFSHTEYVITNEIFEGMDTNTFNPNGSMTRAMFVTILWRLSGCPVASGVAFSDIPDDIWYTKAVFWAAQNGIVQGIGDELFAPNTAITREQMATILYNYEQFSGKVPPNIKSASEFTDHASINDYALATVNALVMQGIIEGRPNNIFNPKDVATRAETAAMIHKFMEALK